MPDDQLSDIEIDIPTPKDVPKNWKDQVEDVLKATFNGEPVTMCRRELYEMALRTQSATQDRISELTEQLETLERMRRVANGHVFSLEAHLEAIRVAVAPDQGKTLFIDMVLRVRGILDGSINIFDDQPIEVVSTVRQNNGLYWVCRRTDEGRHGRLAGMWEYPGGKVKEGETYVDALRREIREEFDVEIAFIEEEPLCSIVSTIPGYTETARVTFYAVRFLSNPTLRVHDQAKWCTVAELQLDDHLPSGAEFNHRLLVAKEQT